jgi:hypothetical protein
VKNAVLIGATLMPLMWCGNCLAQVSSQQAKAPASPERFVSSTLKFAMAELARTSPGGRLVAAGPTPSSVAIRKNLGALKKPLAMTVSLPVLTAQRESAPVAAATVPVRQALAEVEASPNSMSGMRLAIAR